MDKFYANKTTFVWKGTRASCANNANRIIIEILMGLVADARREAVSQPFSIF